MDKLWEKILSREFGLSALGAYVGYDYMQFNPKIGAAIMVSCIGIYTIGRSASKVGEVIAASLAKRAAVVTEETE